MLQTLRNAFKVPEIRKKLLFVLMILVLYRIGAVMPVPFVNSALMNASLNAQLGEGSIFGYLNALSGGAFGQATLFALSVSPYINRVCSPSSMIFLIIACFRIFTKYK